jgi:hypothetical protein
MLRALFQVLRKRNLAEIYLRDEDEPIYGYVTYIDDETFDIYTIDDIFNNAVVVKEGNVIMTETEEGAKSIDFTMIKMTRYTDSVYAVTHDVSHQIPLERLKWFDIQRKFVYNQAEAELREEIAEFEAQQRLAKPKFTNKIAKTNKDDKDKEKLEAPSNDGKNL